GQVLGPAAGALVAAQIGFRRSFVIGAFMLWGCSALVSWGVPSGRPRDAAEGAARTTSLRELVTVALVVLAGSTQVFFLTSILPQILPPLGVPVESTLEVGGVLIFVTGVAAALGAMAAPRLADLMGDRQAVLWFAPVFPLAVAAIAARASGEAIGFINSSRIGAAFIGPVLATTLLAWMRPSLVYLVLAALGLAVVPLVARMERRSRRRAGPKE